MPSPKSAAAPRLLGRPKKTSKYPTWEEPKGSGIKVQEIPSQSAGKVYGKSYLVLIPRAVTGGKRERSQHKTKEDAFRHAGDRLIAAKQHGKAFGELTREAQTEAIQGWRLLQKHGLTDRAKGGGFVKVIEAALRVLRPVGGIKTVSEVIAELKANMALRLERDVLRKDTVSDFNARANKISEVFGEKVASLVTKEDVIAWLHDLTTIGHGQKALAPTTVYNFRKNLHKIFNFAVEKGYCAESPVKLGRSELETYGGKKPGSSVPAVLRPEEAGFILKAAAENLELGMLPSVILRLFCGLRTAEVGRLDWADVRWQEPKPYVRLTGAVTKTRDVRNVELPAIAWEWLALCPSKVGRVSPVPTDYKQCERFAKICSAAKRSEQQARKEAGLPALPKDVRNWNNITRHSFGSYHYALTDSSDQTTAQLGHSTNAMLFKHYRSLVTKADAERYFALRPGATIAEPLPFAQVAGA